MCALWTPDQYVAQHADAHGSGELCSWCFTDHGPGWLEYPEPDWWFGRWLMMSRWTRWMYFGRKQ
jgi:hypothetical protein